MTYKTYELSTRSGIKRQPQIPADWAIRPLWTLFRRTKSLNHPELELLSVYRDYGVLPKSSRDDNFNKPSDDLGAYQLVAHGSLVVNKMKAWQGSIAVSAYRGIVSPAYFVYTPTSNNSVRFLHYLLRSTPLMHEYAAVSSGVRPNQWDLDPMAFSRLKICLPPLHDQHAMADFLDRETAQIDELIAKQNTLIGLLRERRIAVTNRAVTHGLDELADMTESAVEELGDIPSSWNVRPFLHCFSGRVDYRGATPKKTESGVPLVTARNVKRGFIDYSASEEFVEPAEYDVIMRRGSPQVNDVLMTMEAPLGNVALVDRTDVAFAQRVIKFRPGPSIDPDFICIAMNSGYFQSQLEKRATGSTALGIKASKLHSLRLVLPPLSEQRAIAQSISSSNLKSDRMAEKAKAAIVLLQERRSALITAVVTGKIDVRGES